MQYIARFEELLKKYHPHISGTVLALSAIVTVGLISPTIILAQELPSDRPLQLAPSGTLKFMPRAEPDDKRMPARPGVMPRRPSGIKPEIFEQLNKEEHQENYEFKEVYKEDIKKSDYQENEYYKDKNLEYGDQEDDQEFTAPALNDPSEQAEQIKRALLNLRGGYEKFKAQLNQIKKQGVKLPPDVTDGVKKIDGIFANIQKADSIADLQNAGSGEIAEAAETFREHADDLEKLAQLKPALKSADTELRALKNLYAQDARLVKAAGAKGTDLSKLLNQMQAILLGMQTARDKSSRNAAINGAQSYDDLKTYVSDKFAEARALDGAIKILANVSRFNSEFKKGVTEAEQMFAALENKKVDTTNMVAALEKLKITGAAVQAQLTAEPLDQSALTQAVLDFVRARQTWQQARQETLQKLRPPAKKTGPAVDLNVLQGLIAPTGTVEQQ